MEVCSGNSKQTYDTGKCIAFTWSPRNEVYCSTCPKRQMNDVLGYIYLLNKCAEKYSIYPELNASGNLHIHGIIEIKDKVKWFKSVLPTFKRNGFVCIKSNVNSDWIKYIQKDKDLMFDILRIPLPIQRGEIYQLCDSDVKVNLLDYGIQILPGVKDEDIKPDIDNINDMWI